MSSESRGLPLAYLAWFVALAPFITTHVSYLVAASLGHLDWCFPYGEGCYSISSTGRQLPEKLWFKFGMIPSALAAMLLWWAAAFWIKQSAVTTLPKTLRILPILGTIATLFLMLYTVALGEEGDAYRLTRRIGIILSFSLTFMSQLLLLRLLSELASKSGFDYLAVWNKRLLVVLVVLLVTGILSVILSIVLGEAYKNIENGFEWTMALMLNSYFVLLALMWRQSKVRVVLTREG